MKLKLVDAIIYVDYVTLILNDGQHVNVKSLSNIEIKHSFKANIYFELNDNLILIEPDMMELFDTIELN